MREILAKFLESESIKQFSMELSDMEINHYMSRNCIVFQYDGHRFCCFFRDEARVMGCDGEEVMRIPTRKVA